MLSCGELKLMSDSKVPSSLASPCPCLNLPLAVDHLLGEDLEFLSLDQL